MRTAAGFVLVALLLAVPTAPRAHAEGAPKKVDAVGAVARLERAVDAGDSTWENLYDLYVKAKEAMAEEKDEAVKTEAETAYAAIRGKVAKALERDHLPMNGWFMGIFAALLLWGGFGWCLRIAMKSTPQHELDEDESWPIRPEEP